MIFTRGAKVGLESLYRIFLPESEVKSLVTGPLPSGVESFHGNAGHYEIYLGGRIMHIGSLNSDF